MRELDLPSMLVIMGGVEVPGSRAGHRTRKFKVAGKSIAATGNLWIDNSTGQGGRGAIDLVMHLEDCNFKTATRILAGVLPAAQTVATTTPTPKPAPALPASVASNWPRAQRYLVQVRKIPVEVVDRAFSLGLIYADERSNIVFVREGDGCFKRGSYDPVDKPAFKQTLGRDAGPFLLPGNDDGHRVFVAEGPIDALALKAINPTAAVLATGGSFPPARLLPYLAGTGQVLLAHDADGAGNEQAQRIAVALAAVGVTAVRHRPPAKDWSAALVAEPGLAHFSFLPAKAPLSALCLPGQFPRPVLVEAT
jgi:hypothetical protein